MLYINRDVIHLYNETNYLTELYQYNVVNNLRRLAGILLEGPAVIIGGSHLKVKGLISVSRLLL